jgi:hypothetical protein
MPNNCILNYAARLGYDKNGALGIGSTFDSSWNTGAVTYSADSLTATIGGNSNAVSAANITSGRKYFEMTYAAVARYAPVMGIVTTANAAAGYGGAGAIALWPVDGGSVQIAEAGTVVETHPEIQITSNDILGVMLDFDAQTVSFFKNGQSIGISRPMPGNSYRAHAGSPGSAYLAQVTANFGAKPFM